MTTPWKIELVEGSESVGMTCSVVCGRGENSFPTRICGAPAIALFGENPVCDEHRLPGPWQSQTIDNYQTYWLRCYTNANTICASVNRRGYYVDWEINATSNSGSRNLPVVTKAEKSAAVKATKAYVDTRLLDAIELLPKALVLRASRTDRITINRATPDELHIALACYDVTKLEAMQIGAEIERVWSTRSQASR